MVALVVVIVSGVALAEPMRTKKADSFRTNGDLIAGWYWLRRSGHYAMWNWKPIVVGPKKVCVNFNLLVTNKINGGSGYSCVVGITILDFRGRVVEKGKMKLYNPFRPQNPQYTRGVGYSAYGAYCLKNPRIIRGGFKVIIKWPPVDSKYHVAVAHDKATLAYTY